MDATSTAYPGTFVTSIKIIFDGQAARLMTAMPFRRFCPVSALTLAGSRLLAAERRGLILAALLPIWGQ